MAVEYLFPCDYDKGERAENFTRNGLTQVLFDSPACNRDARDKGDACRPDSVGECQDGVRTAM